MGYPESLKNLIKKVEETRPERVEKKKAGIEIPAMTLDERADILENFHPDCIPGTRRELKIGPSKGYAVAHEFADLLETARTSGRARGQGLRVRQLPRHPIMRKTKAQWFAESPYSYNVQERRARTRTSNRRGGPARTPIHLGIQSVYACLAAKHSAETGQFVEVRQVGQRQPEE